MALDVGDPLLRRGSAAVRGEDLMRKRRIPPALCVPCLLRLGRSQKG